jgi:MarR family transcriptional regulator for hemolysin
MVAKRDEGRTVWTLIRTISHLMERARARELARYGITVPQAGILRHIKQMGERATPSALARALFREPTSVSAILTRMEKLGLVERTAGPDRRNQVGIRLTERGEKAHLLAMENQTERHVASQLPHDTLQRLEEDLVDFRACLLDEMAGSYREVFSARLQNLEGGTAKSPRTRSRKPGI